MPGMEFEYDEHGGTSYYFVLSFLAFILVPLTYYLLPRGDSKDELSKKNDCHCSGCEKKRLKLKSKGTWQTIKSFLKIAIIVIGWGIFAFVAYKASQVELDTIEFDPFRELELDAGATDREIKKAYRRLSLIYHPDKETGDEKRFMKISKAYQALTNEEAKENYEKYGNPDGPGAMQFGIALPKWIVEKKNSVWVLAVYGLVFMIILPVAVGSWWYNSIKYSAEHTLMDTERIYHIFPQKTTNMNLYRVIMVLASSFEFWRRMNKEMQERPSDDVEVPKLMKKMTNIGEKNKEAPLCYPHSLKARVLLHAHLWRLNISEESMLQIDTDYIVKKSPFLLNEMIKATQNLRMLGMAGRIPANRVPRVETIENMMRVCQMIVQGCWDKSSFLQLPHVTEDDIRYFSSKKRRCRSVKDLVRMKDSDRRLMLRNLTDPQYSDVMNVLANMPLVSMEIEVKVVDDEETHVITASSLVTVLVHLTRKPLSSLFDKDSLPNGMALSHETGLAETLGPEEGMQDSDGEEEGESSQLISKEDKDRGEEEEPSEEQTVNQPQKVQVKPWEINKRKKPKGGKKGSRNSNKPAAKTTNATNHKKVEANSANSTPKPAKSRKAPDPVKAAAKDSEGSSNEEEDEEGSAPGEGGDEVDWDELQRDIKKDTILDSKSAETHPVHCPRYPGIKYEWWWLYICETDSKRIKRFVTAPQQVCSLKTNDTVELKFEAPPKKGHFNYTAILRSDSYICDFDQTQKFEIQVSEAKQIDSHPQWDFTDDEEEKEDEEDSESDDDSEESDDD